MLLKRSYDENGQVVSVEVLRATKEQHFSTGLVEAGQRDGWMEISGKRISLRSEPRLVYTIKRWPGYYCCYCGKPQVGSLEAREHVAAEHSDNRPAWKKLFQPDRPPDPQNPSGYEKINYFDCVMED